MEATTRNRLNKAAEALLKGYKHFVLDGKMFLVFSAELCDCGEEILAANSTRVLRGTLNQTRLFLLSQGLTPKDSPDSEGYYDERTDGTCCDACKE